jgi:hypothetical protein
MPKIIPITQTKLIHANKDKNKSKSKIIKNKMKKEINKYKFKKILNR